MNAQRRQTIAIGPALAGLLEAGYCPGTGLGSRLDTLAGRYMSLISDPALLPTGWPVEAWAALIAAVREIDTRIPTAPYSLIGYLRAIKPHPTLTYAAESLSRASLHALIALAERAQGIELRDTAAVADVLRQNGVRLEGASTVGP